jgi:beta-phosphoglucomutase
MNPGAVIFDMDGVLVDSEPLYDQATTLFLRDFGVEADSAFYDRLRGLTLPAVWGSLKDRYALPQPLAELAAESSRRLDLFFAELPGLEPMPGARELVAALRTEGVALAVASSSRRSRVELLLRRLGLEPAFAAVVSGDDVERGKPDPEIFLAAADRLDVAPARCAVLEDADRGVRAALAAGMRCVALDRGQGGQPGLALAHLTVTDLRDLSPARLRTLWDRSG